MSSPARSRPKSFDLAVIALSARALAASASRGGLSALAIDLFADADTREHAAFAAKAPGRRGGPGFSRAGLLAALEAHAPAGLPVVLGAGFEHTPDLMRVIARRNPILGATPQTVRRLKDPVGFAELLAALRIPHPQIGPGAARPPYPARSPALGAAGRQMWISKRAGASGGAHIGAADRSGAGSRRYLQEHIEGRAVSALFLAHGSACMVIGFSEQWADPECRAPFRYGGAVGPVTLAEPLASAIARSLDGIVAATGLVGLASADLILPAGSREPSYCLLEINPRPGAALDVFDRGDMPPLLGLHLDASAGRLPDRLPVLRRARAAAVVYAERAIRSVRLPRPVWTADWPSCDETVPAGAPVCTILAAGPSPDAARSLVMERRAALLASLRAVPARKNQSNKAKAPA